MRASYSYGGLVIKPASGWGEVVAPPDKTDVPFTLSKSGGTGALHFSMPKYISGDTPEFSMGSLERLLAEFATSCELGAAFDAAALEVPPLRIAASSFVNDADFVRAWYCSDGRNLALVTYVCDESARRTELPECEQMVADLAFQL